jgi:hypothetical protein
MVALKCGRIVDQFVRSAVALMVIARKKNWLTRRIDVDEARILLKERLSSLIGASIISQDIVMILVPHGALENAQQLLSGDHSLS